MTNIELQELLKEFPDETPVLISLDTSRIGFISSYNFEVTAVNDSNGQYKQIELIGDVYD